MLGWGSPSGLEKRGVEEMCMITRVGGARREGERAWGGGLGMTGNSGHQDAGGPLSGPP